MEGFANEHGKKFEKVKRNYGITFLDVDPQSFTGLTFSGIVRKSNDEAVKEINTSTKSTDRIPPASSASISIPRTVFNDITNSLGQQIIRFAFYKETKFFAISLPDPIDTSSRLNSFVVAGCFIRLQIANLTEPVKIVFQSIEPGDTRSTLCSYWDFVLGNWSQEGCRFERVLKDGRTVCNCDHFTNFAILMVG